MLCEGGGVMEKFSEWFVSAVFVLGFNGALIFLMTLALGDWLSGVVAFLLLWVMLWDRRHIAKKMQEHEPPK